MATLATATVSASAGNTNLGIPITASGAATIQIASVNHPEVTRQISLNINPVYNVSNVRMYDHTAGDTDIITKATENQVVDVMFDYLGCPTTNGFTVALVPSSITGADWAAAWVAAQVPQEIAQGATQKVTLTVPESLNADFKIIVGVGKKSVIGTPTNNILTTAYPLTITRSFTTLSANASVNAGDNLAVTFGVDDIDGNATISVIQ